MTTTGEVFDGRTDLRQGAAGARPGGLRALGRGGGSADAGRGGADPEDRDGRPVALSTFSGVGGMDLGLARAGWRHVGFAEADEYRRAVLAERWPTVPRWSDVRDVGRKYPDHDPYGRAHRISPGHFEVGEGDRGASGRRDAEPRRVDLLAGGFPCQDLSVAGRRRGLAGERSGLFFAFADLAESLRPEWLLIENVPGLLSSNGGRDFGELLGTLADLGYGVGWRILDSRFFGVPQRRRRVFIVAHDSGGRAGAERAGAVLAVGSGCGGHPAPGGEEGPGVAGALTGRSASRLDDACAGGGQLVTHALTSAGHDASEDGTGRGTPLTVVNALDRMAGGPDDNAAQAGHLVPVGFHLTQDPISPPGASLPLGHKSTGNGVQHGASVRRLTPVECERLQGLPDGWTDIPWNGKPHTPDSRRYAACGDAVTAPVAEWIGRRLMAAMNSTQEESA